KPLLNPQLNHSWTWTDTDGDGQVDFVSPTDATDEVFWRNGIAWGWGQTGSIDVDSQGNLWVSNSNLLGSQNDVNTIYKIPLAGFEKVAGQDKYNPIYRFADAQVFVLGSSMRDPQGAQQVAYTAKPTSDGGILAESYTKGSGEFPTIRLFDAAGQ